MVRYRRISNMLSFRLEIFIYHSKVVNNMNRKIRSEQEIKKRVIWRGEDGRLYEPLSIREVAKSLGGNVFTHRLEYCDLRTNKREILPSSYVMTLVEIGDGELERVRYETTTGSMVDISDRKGRYNRFVVEFWNQAREMLYPHESVGDTASRLAERCFRPHSQKLMTIYVGETNAGHVLPAK